MYVRLKENKLQSNSVEVVTTDCNLKEVGNVITNLQSKHGTKRLSFEDIFPILLPTLYEFADIDTSFLVS